MAYVSAVELKKRKRVKLILPANNTRKRLGREARLVDAETGEEIPGVRNMALNMPLESMMTVTVEMVVDEIEFAKE